MKNGITIPLAHRLYRKYVGFRWPGTMLITSKDHNLYLVSPSNSTVEKNLTKWGVYEEEETQFIKKFIKEWMIVVDVGAHIGYYTILLSKLVGETGKVFAFEPNYVSSGYLKANVAINNCKNVVIFEGCLLDRFGEVFYKLNTTNLADTRNQDTDIGVPFNVKCSTLDKEIGENKVNFIKVDIDGSEEKFINGAMATLKRNKPCILIERHQFKSEKIPNVLKSLGYVEREIKHGSRNTIYLART